MALTAWRELQARPRALGGEPLPELAPQLGRVLTYPFQVDAGPGLDLAMNRRLAPKGSFVGVAQALEQFGFRGFEGSAGTAYGLPVVLPAAHQLRPVVQRHTAGHDRAFPRWPRLGWNVSTGRSIGETHQCRGKDPPPSMVSRASQGILASLAHSTHGRITGV